MSTGNRVDLRQIFLGLQRQMVATLQAERDVISHPGTKGAASELHWLKMLECYLPKRYCVDSAFVLDCNGALSDQIDVVIYDRQYSPFLFNQDGAKYVPAESVYAVLEVKPEITAAYVKYAGEKAASVRRLERTSARIPHAGGMYEPKVPPRILAGLLALESSWTPVYGGPFRSAINELASDEVLDFGCALRDGGFRVDTDVERGRVICTSEQETALMYFFLNLLSKLQAVGTVAAVEFERYARVL